MNVGPLPLLILPLLVGGAIFLLRRWKRIASWVGAAAALLMGVALLALPLEGMVAVAGRVISLGESITVLGRPVVLSLSDRLVMGFLFLMGAYFFFLSGSFEREGLLAPLGLGVLGLVAGVLVIRPLIYAVLFLEIAATLVIFPLHAEGRTPARGGLRYLSFCTLALPGLLISHWLLDMYAVSPDQRALLYTAMALIGVSFALLLGLFPFFAWVPMVGEDGEPLAAGFVYSVGLGAVWFLLLEYLQTYPWLVELAEWGAALSVAGTVTAVVGGVLGTTRRSPGALMGYAAMVDTGLAVVALGEASQRGVGVGIWLLFARSLGTVLMAGGLASARRQGAAGDMVRRAPWSTAAVVVGAVSLAGLPPTVGFAARWSMFLSLLPADPVRGLLLLLASVGPAIGFLRFLINSLQSDEEGRDIPPTKSPVGIVALHLLLLGVLLLGIFPRPLATLAGQIAAFFTLWGM